MAKSKVVLIEAIITMQGKNRAAKTCTILNISTDKSVTDSVHGVKKEVTFELRIKG